MLEEYKERMSYFIDEVYAGIESYAITLEDLDGEVMTPIYSMRNLTEEYVLPEVFDKNYIFSLLDEAEAGAENYASELYDTTDCTYPLDQILDYLQEF